MAEPLHDLEPLRERFAERWDAQRTERTLRGLHQKRARARRRRHAVALSFGLSLIALLGSVVYGSSSSRSPSLALQPPQAAPLSLRLSDGSAVALRDARTQVEVAEASPQLIALELVAGRARFDVQRRPTRRFRVRAGDVTVEVLGTSFEVEREAGRAHVAVRRGRVAVRWPGGRTELVAGEAGWFPRSEASDAPGEKSAEVAEERRATASARPSARKRESAASWREPARQGQFERAYALMNEARTAIADDVDDLLLAADTARLSGHPHAALPYLRRVVAKHAADSRASLAAFTLGGVLMQQLGQPREAEAAYARARALSFNASLAEDALARQVEAAHRAGDAAHARALAAEYLERYPGGRRTRAVKRFGDLPH